MRDDSAPDVPPHGRLVSAGLAVAAAIGLLLNHFAAGSQNFVYLMVLCLGPIALFLGIGGLFEPKILWSVGKYGKHLPVIYKLIGGTLGALGVAVTILLVLYVYPLGPPARKPAMLLPKAVAETTQWRSRQPPARSSRADRHLVPKEVLYLTYARPEKRWVKMDETAMQGVRRENTEGTTTLHYAEGEHPLLKVLWPDVLEVGDCFTVELQGANSVEMVDVEGADANARTSLPTSGKFVVVEITREKNQIIFTCDGKSQQSFYASGKLRGDEAKLALLATALRPGFSVKRGEKASFRCARIVKP